MRRIIVLLALIFIPLVLPASNANAGTCVCKTSASCIGPFTQTDVDTRAECADICGSGGPNDACVTSFSASATTSGSTPPKGLGAAVGVFKETGTKAGFPEGALPPEVVIGQLIKSLIILMGVIFGVLMVYAGFLWMTARGDETQIKKSKAILESATIGIIIVVAAYAITTFVVDKVISTAFQPAQAPEAQGYCTTDAQCNLLGGRCTNGVCVQ